MDSKRIKALSKSVQDALDLLHDRDFLAVPSVASEPLPSLLEQCQILLSEITQPKPFRTVHHFACTGGTLISKAIAALPNTILLSEIDPLSQLNVKDRNELVPFTPTDILSGLNYSLRPIDQQTYIETFCAGINVLKENLDRQGYSLVIRDHAHSQFCTNTFSDNRPTLFEMLRTQGSILGLVTVRHPLDSYLSLLKNQWLHFNPSTLEDYAKRYHQFLDKHAHLPIVKYEHFVLEAQSTITEIAQILDLTRSEFVLDFVQIMQLSGDSGRKSDAIAPRSRGEIPLDTKLFDGPQENYERLCVRLGYNPDYGVDPYSSM